MCRWFLGWFAFGSLVEKLYGAQGFAATLSMKLFQHSWLFFVALVGSLALRCSSMVVRQTMYSVDAVRTDPEFGSTTFPYMFPTFVLALFAKILYAIWPPKGSFYVMF